MLEDTEKALQQRLSCRDYGPEIEEVSCTDVEEVTWSNEVGVAAMDLGFMEAKDRTGIGTEELQQAPCHEGKADYYPLQ